MHRKKLGKQDAPITGSMSGISPLKEYSLNHFHSFTCISNHLKCLIIRLRANRGPGPRSFSSVFPPSPSANIFPDQTHKPSTLQQQLRRHKGAMTGYIFAMLLLAHEDNFAHKSKSTSFGGVW